ncbi:unnamed protein product [Cylicocyclus nassatus]|uniref:EGF-like domain-containing protein n=1 Tax=Cylicocyclus nassatus TaxID=53992 RepID=A0AA36H455_CYLNA|nr:unnamed protein product [Cylicocyclus nassatus]
MIPTETAVLLGCLLLLESSAMCEETEGISTFDDLLADRFDGEFEQMSEQSQKELLHKIGVIALYYRIYKQLLPLPGDELGYMYRFPEPVSALDMKLVKSCEVSLKSCVSEILATIQKAHPWIYPTKSHRKPDTELSTAVLKDIISDNLLSTEITATQILCFLTMRKNSAFSEVPFCRFDLEDNKRHKRIWPAHVIQKSAQFIDEYYGEPYQCARKSFCPDPCCHGVPSSSLLFSSWKCGLNKCFHRERCRIEASFNDDFASIRMNKWNTTCPCGKGLSYRPDVESCVHSDLCSEFQRCPAAFDCINTISDPGYKCICQLGYIKDELGRCVPINMSSSAWHGFAFSEKHPQSSIKGQIRLISILLITFNVIMVH